MLETDGAYIMHWLLEGCRKWYKEGYGTFETIEQATDQYKNDEDVLGNFINECCKLDKGFSIQANRLRTAFEKWCNENGEHIFSGRAWRQALEERGFARSHGMYGKTWKGLTLMEEYNNDAIYLFNMTSMTLMTSILIKFQISIEKIFFMIFQVREVIEVISDNLRRDILC
jgi:putative DNA primase/helicase